MTRQVSRIGSARGVALVDVLMVAAVLAVVAAMALPAFSDLTVSMRLAQGAREVERELQGARLRAVGGNRAIRVRFDCPSAGRYRFVELLGTPGTPQADDTALRRCDPANYPYPAPDNDPVTVPNNDGAPRQLPQQVTFNASRTIEFRPDGSAHADAGTGTPWPVIPGTGISIVLQQGSKLRTITVNGIGKIQLQP